MQVLSESLEALPMMAERTMIQVDDVDLFALPEDDRTQLAALFSDIPDYACLVLVYADFKPDKRKKKLWDAMEKNAVLAEFAYQTERDLTAWIVRHFRAEKKNISSALCRYLLQRCGSSMTRLDAEIAKICAYSGAGRHCPRGHRRRLWSRRSRRSSLRSPTPLGQREFDRALERLSVMLNCGPSHRHARRGRQPYAQAPRRTHPAGGRKDLAGPCPALRCRAVCGQQVLCAGAEAVGPFLLRRLFCCAARPTGR